MARRADDRLDSSVGHNLTGGKLNYSTKQLTSQNVGHSRKSVNKKKE